jgi:DNA-binding SARP family transcriptional activator
MEFRILGPLEVLEDGRQVDLGGAKQRALLAILLLHANDVVSSDRLIDALWEDEPPGTAQKALQVYVSQLRKVVGRERLETKTPGYRLLVGSGELDLERFQRLAEDEPREALALWHGQLLAEFVYQRFAQSEIARLDELRLACLERRIDLDLEEGRHAALVGELESLVREHPLRERLRAQLMLALYRSGRQAEALDAYQDARRTLTEELGIEPGRPLRDLQQAILEQQPALDVTVVDEAAPQLPAAAAGPRVSPTEQDVRPERKTVTVVHSQLAVTSPHGGEVDPEVLRHVLNRASGEITSAVEAHEGTIDAITGNSVTAVFGLPAVHEDDPSRAVRAAEDIRSRLGQVAAELEGDRGHLELRLGVSTGEVMTGSGTESGLRATGAPFTTASRLAQQAEPDTIVLDDSTRRASEGRRDAIRFTSPMVGRARERRRLHSAFEQVVGDSSCQLFTILGAAGVGKSRLVQEFLGDLDDSALVARGRCLPYGEGITFWPVLEAVKDVAGVDETDTADVASSGLAALIEGDENAVFVAQRVTEVLGLTEATVGVEEGFEAVRAFFVALAARRPLVVVFDDVHWGEPTFLDLVEHLADWSRGAPILLLCMARPELLDVRPSWAGGKLNATSVLLEPLSDDECMELVANLVGEAELAEEVEARIANAAEGNPLFVEEMLSMLIDEGILVRENGRWAAAGDITAFPVPPTIHALLAARLDQLSADERAAIEPAAVEGKVFHESSVVQLVPQIDTPAALAALVRKELIRPDRPAFAGDRAFRFRHLMIRDAAYDSIPKEVRANWHARHADWLDGKVGVGAAEFDEIVGYHLEQAYRYRAELGSIDAGARELGRRAAERLGAAGRRAFLRSDGPAGANLISRAVALLPADDPLRVDLVPNVRVIQGLADLRWADRVLTDAVEAAATTGNRRLAAHALVQRGLLRLFTDANVTSTELLDVSGRAIAAFEELEDELGMTRAWRLAAQAHYLARTASACAEASERALAFARRSDDAFELREIVEWLGIALLLGPAPVPKALERCRELLEEFASYSLIRAEILSMLAPLTAMRGDLDEALELRGSAREIMDAEGEWIWVSSFWGAFIYLWRGDPGTVEPELQAAYEALKKFGETSHFSSITHALANVAYAQGRYSDAARLTQECEAASHANDVHSYIGWRSVRAKVLARRGELEAAEALSRDAIAYALETDFLPARAEALADLAEVLTIAGRDTEAARALEDAIAVNALKGNVLMVDVLGDRLASIRATGSAQQSVS